MASGFLKSKRLGEAISISMLLAGLNLLFVIINRLAEIIILLSQHRLANTFSDSVAGLFFDVALIALLSVVLLVIVYLLLAINRRIAVLTTIIISLLYHMVYLPVVYLYGSTLIPLDRLLFARSFQDIITLDGTAGVSFASIIFFILIYGSLFIISAWWIFRKLPPFAYRRNIIAITLILAFLAVTVNPGQLKLPSGHSKNIINNKSLVFYRDALKPLLFNISQASVRNIQGNAKRYQSLFNRQQYVSPDYAFLNKRLDSNPWGEFFPVKDLRPSVFIIVVEGLGNNQLRHDDGVVLMPFLESLSNQSLYWEHFLATGERAFATLPSIIGSLPHGDAGFSMLDDMPLHLTLINQLKANGYQSAFYYGQGGYVQEKEAHLRRSYIDRIIDKKDFNEDYIKIIDPETDYHWGYHDQDLVRNYFRISQGDDGCSKLEIIFTGSMRSPFVIENEEYYDAKYNDIISKAGISQERKQFYQENRHYLRTLLFTDDALRYFFENQGKLSCYSQSIFIITGDHPMPEMPENGPLKKYHVPLILYSPMLKEPKTLISLASHFDVAPALINLLEHNFGIAFGKYSHMFGVPADTKNTFSTQNIVPFMRSNRQIDELVYNNFFLAGDQLYEIIEGLNIIPYQDRTVKDQMINMLDAYNRVNDDMIRKARLLPDSVFFDQTRFQSIADTIFNRGLLIESGQEYIDIYNVSAQLSPGQDIYLHVRGEFYPEVSGNMPMIIYEITNQNDSTLYWESFGLPAGQKSDRFSMLPHVNHFSHIIPELEIPGEYEISIYLWNRDRSGILFDNLEVKSFGSPRVVTSTPTGN